MSFSLDIRGINRGGSSTTPISFNQLRLLFFQNNPDTPVSPSTGIIRASDLLRTTSLPTSSDPKGQTNPRVPDAIENSNIVTTTSDWKISHFQQSSKWYIWTQSGTDTNVDLTTRTWNNNRIKNIVKRIRITGICGATSSLNTAASFMQEAYNLRIEVSGSILGYGGRGGGTSGAPAISGESGGSAMEVRGYSGRIVVDVSPSGRIYGGGGGGERGKNGSSGTTGTCSASTTTSGCSFRTGAPGCPDPYYSDRTSSGEGCAYVSYCCGFFCCGCVRPLGKVITRYCVYYATSSTPTAGIGGVGGAGRGYNYQSGSLTGAGGTKGTCPTCSFGTISGGSCGGTGETGGSGGDWGSPGGTTNNTGNGGSSGAAVFGSNYNITGTISSLTFRGSY